MNASAINFTDEFHIFLSKNYYIFSKTNLNFRFTISSTNLLIYKKYKLNIETKQNHLFPMIISKNFNPAFSFKKLINIYDIIIKKSSQKYLFKFEIFLYVIVINNKLTNNDVLNQYMIVKRTYLKNYSGIK